MVKYAVLKSLYTYSCILISIYDVPHSTQVRVELYNEESKQTVNMTYRDVVEMDEHTNEIRKVKFQMEKECKDERVN